MFNTFTFIAIKDIKDLSIIYVKIFIVRNWLTQSWKLSSVICPPQAEDAGKWMV